MRHILLIGLFLLPPGLATAQLRSGPDAPAVSSQLPPSIPPGNSRPGPEGPLLAPSLTPDPAPRIPEPPGPPSEHEVLGGPPVPGAIRPRHSEGFVTDRDVIPPHVGAGPSLSEVPPVVR